MFFLYSFEDLILNIVHFYQSWLVYRVTFYVSNMIVSMTSFIFTEENYAFFHNLFFFLGGGYNIIDKIYKTVFILNWASFKKLVYQREVSRVLSLKYIPSKGRHKPNRKFYGPTIKAYPFFGGGV